LQLSVVGAGVAARHESDEWKGSEKTVPEIFSAKFPGILDLDLMQVRPMGPNIDLAPAVLRPTGTIILAIRAYGELWCMSSKAWSEGSKQEPSVRAC